MKVYAKINKYREMSRFALSLAIGLFFTTLIVGCALVGESKTEEQQLRDRVELRWLALIEDDFKKAYLFETPGYRKVKSYKHFKTGYGQAIEWTGVKVKSIDLSSMQSTSTAEVRLELEYNMEFQRGEMINHASVFTEIWMKVENNWWHVTKN